MEAKSPECRRLDLPLDSLTSKCLPYEDRVLPKPLRHLNTWLVGDTVSTVGYGLDIQMGTLHTLL